MKWAFGDGTVAELGGDVEGESPFAASLRRIVARTRAGNPEPLTIGMQPGGFRVLDLGDAQLMNCWLRIEADAHGVAVLHSPEVDAYVDDVESDAGPDAIY